MSRRGGRNCGDRRADRTVRAATWPQTSLQEFTNRASLEAWARGQSREAVLAIAVRAALRVAPLAIGRPASTRIANPASVDLMAEIFRANALAWVSRPISASRQRASCDRLQDPRCRTAVPRGRSWPRCVAYAHFRLRRLPHVSPQLSGRTRDRRASDCANAVDAAASAAGTGGASALSSGPDSFERRSGSSTSQSPSALYGTQLWSGVVPSLGQRCMGNGSSPPSIRGRLGGMDRLV